MANKPVLKITALTLGLIYILSFISVISGAASIGATIFASTVNIATNASYTKIVAWHPQYMREEANVITYTPNQSGAKPIAAYGAKLYGRSNINQVIDYETSSESKYILGGMNGDFYSLQTGVPLGLVVHNGKLISSDDSHAGVGFMSDGSCIIGTPGLNISMKAGSQTIAVDYFNKYRTQYGVYLFSDDFSSDTKTSALGTHIILKIVSGKIAIGQTVQAKVTQIKQDTASIALDPNTLVISVDNSGPLERIKDIVPDQNISITFKASDDRWNKVTEAIGGGDIIVSNGVAVPATDTSIASVNPRTAIGVKSNGQVVMAQIDGREDNHSAGATFTDLSGFMLEQGCVTAINLDGGGSSTTAVRLPGDTEVNVVNNPSDGSVRANANFILLANTAARTSTAKLLNLYPYNINILPNTQIGLNIKATDANYYDVSVPSSSTVSYTVDDKTIGTVQKGTDSASWSFTAASIGSTTIRAKSGTAQGSTAVTVLDKIDDMFVYNQGTANILESINLSPGGTQKFDVAAYLNTQKVYSQNSSFKWEVSDSSLGSFTSPGVFTAGTKKGASGYIKVSYGDLSRTINVTVGKDTQVIYDFEKPTGSFSTSYSKIKPSVSINTDKGYIRYGVGSLEFDYAPDTQMATSAKVYASLDAISPKALDGSPKYINLWVYGDNSGNDMYAVVTDSQNNDIKIPYDQKLNFTGWKLVSAKIDTQNYPVKLKTPFGVTASAQTKASKIYIDQLSVTYDAKLADIAGPVINIDVPDKSSSTLNVSASVLDDTSAVVSKQNISVKIDAQSVDFNYDAAGNLSLSIKNNFSPGLHKISITAVDNAGNVSYKYATLDYSDRSTEPFCDTNGHWAQKYINYVYDQNIVQGTVDNKTGNRYFYPDNDISRAEFAVMLCKFLNLDISAYTDVSLPFSDTSKIKDWALPYVRALYANGIMNGKPASDGSTVFDPSAKLTRAEIITAIGKLMPKGYKESDIAFTDAADIGSWSVPYVKMLTGMGVVNGYDDGTLLPKNSVKRCEAAKIFYSIY